MVGPEVSAEELLRRVSLREEAAFEALHLRIAGPVFALCHSMLADLELAEDTAQEVLLEVWQTASRFDPSRGSAHGWVSTMAYRQSRDRVRSVRAAQRRELRVGLAQLDRDYDDVVETIAMRLEVEQVRACLEGLSKRQREAVTMAYYGGHSQSQVADLLNLPLGTAKTRIREGMARLRDCLEGTEPSRRPRLSRP